ncbi:MAG: molecular chaperone GrpE [Parcubacteria group bacterium Gr01-1014_46]|nr:MAG: molecular chaperone GrpE [Parcubacteria group bacterium Gr01-1014_46]
MKDDEIKKLHEDEVDTDPGDGDVEDITLEDMSENLAPEIKDRTDKLKIQIKELQKKNAELLDSWQRDKADFINTRKRDEEDKKEFLKFAKADIISELLPVLDSFESAMKNKEAWEKVDKNWRTGVEYIHTQLSNALISHGLKVINPLGEMYNSGRDEAIETVKVDDKNEDGKILDVVQVGYELNGKEIRPPKVRVASYS